jgi:uroporphyrinogen decarboxylase
MNRRQRFLETMTFGQPDRPASGDYFYYDSTRRRWESEGLPKDADLNEYFSMDFDPFKWVFLTTNPHGIIPNFEETVLEERDEVMVVRRCGGEVVRILKNSPPPAMPQWVRYPLQSRQDWQDHKRRLAPDDPARFPENLSEQADKLKDRDYPVGIWLGGTYGEMRMWWGVEELSMLFHDEPALIEEMVERLTELSLAAMDRVLASGVKLDWVMFWEDMAYKTASLLSPAMYRKYCFPFYRKVMDKVRAAGVPVVMLDSDGNIEELIPLWLDLGIKVMHPMEVAAGMDVIRCRKKYGRRIGFFGGIDKRALAGTREQIRAEVVPKLECCFEDGGFIPACDHAIPPDVSLDNFRYYRELVIETSRRMYG